MNPMRLLIPIWGGLSPAKKRKVMAVYPAVLALAFTVGYLCTLMFGLTWVITWLTLPAFAVGLGLAAWIKRDDGAASWRRFQEDYPDSIGRRRSMAANLEAQGARSG